MKIDATGAYRAYAQNSLTQPQQERERAAAQPSREHKQDRVSISSAAAKSDQDRMVYTVAAEVEAKGSPARLQELRQAVAAGQYKVPTEKLADALLSAYV